MNACCQCKNVRRMSVQLYNCIISDHPDAWACVCVCVQQDSSRTWAILIALDPRTSLTTTRSRDKWIKIGIITPIILHWSCSWYCEAVHRESTEKRIETTNAFEMHSYDWVQIDANRGKTKKTTKQRRPPEVGAWHVRWLVFVRNAELVLSCHILFIKRRFAMILIDLILIM